MSYSKTSEIPRDHPLAKLIERSMRTHRLPSCEGCRHYTKGFREPEQTRKITGHCLTGDSLLFALPSAYIALQVADTFFCAAWEPRT